MKQNSLQDQTRPPPANYNNGYPQGYESEPTVRVQRAQTMPSQPQYTAYNPALHSSIPVPGDDREGQRPAAYGVQRVPESEWPRESVGAVLDAYYDPDPEYHDDHVDDYANHNGYHQGSQAGYAESGPRTNFSRPGPSPQNRHGSASNFTHEAHRAQSQPDLHDSYSAASPYDGVAEMPAAVPPLPTGNGYMSRSNVPSSLRTGSPAPGSTKSLGSIKSSTGSVQTSRPSVQPDDGLLPIHP